MWKIHPYIKRDVKCDFLYVCGPNLALFVSNHRHQRTAAIIFSHIFGSLTKAYREDVNAFWSTRGRRGEKRNIFFCKKKITKGTLLLERDEDVTKDITCVSVSSEHKSSYILSKIWIDISIRNTSVHGSSYNYLLCFTTCKARIGEFHY